MKPIISFDVITLLSSSFSQKTKAQSLDTTAIEAITGIKGKSNNGEITSLLPIII